jgi:hypothetical protein
MGVLSGVGSEQVGTRIAGQSGQRLFVIEPGWVRDGRILGELQNLKKRYLCIESDQKK